MTTLLIIVLNVIVSVFGWNSPEVIEKNSFNPYRILKYKEWSRFLTSGFFHADTGHLFFNMFSLFFFGRAVETYFDRYTGSGSFYFLILYISALIVSDVGTFFKHKTDTRYHSIGASGAVSAIVFSGIWFYPIEKIYVMFIPMPGFIFGGLYLLYSAWAANNRNNGYINHDSHFYGSLWGVLFTILVEPRTIGAFFSSLGQFQLF